MNHLLLPAVATLAVGGITLVVIKFRSLVVHRRATFDSLPLPSLFDYLDPGEVNWLLGGLVIPPEARLRAWKRMCLHLNTRVSLFKEYHVFQTQIVSTKFEHDSLHSVLGQSAARRVFVGSLWGHQMLLIQEYDRGQRDRKRLNHAFQLDLATFLPEMLAAGERLRNNMLSEPQFEPKAAVARATLEVVGVAALGVDLSRDDVLASHVAKHFDMILSLVAAIPYVGFSLVHWLYRDSTSAVNKFLAETISNREAKLAQLGGDEIEMDMLSRIIKASAEIEQVEGVSRIEWLMDNLRLMYIAGTDTTAYVFSWLLTLLAHNPLIQKKLVLEIDACNPTVAHAELSRMKYLDACVLETLRLYPAVLNRPRHLRPEDTLEGRHWGDDPNMFFTVDITIHHHDESVFGERPDEYRPERWLGGEPITPTRHKLVAFSTGTRNCIGQHLATAEMKAFAVAVLGNHRVELVDPSEPVPKVTYRGMPYMNFQPKLRLVERSKVVEE